MYRDLKKVLDEQYGLGAGRFRNDGFFQNLGRYLILIFNRPLVDEFFGMFEFAEVDCHLGGQLVGEGSSLIAGFDVPAAPETSLAPTL
jgi:hypothetical protein